MLPCCLGNTMLSRQWLSFVPWHRRNMLVFRALPFQFFNMFFNSQHSCKLSLGLCCCHIWTFSVYLICPSILPSIPKSSWWNASSDRTVDSCCRRDNEEMLCPALLSTFICLKIPSLAHETWSTWAFAHLKTQTNELGGDGVFSRSTCVNICQRMRQSSSDHENYSFRRPSSWKNPASILMFVSRSNPVICVQSKVTSSSL